MEEEDGCCYVKSTEVKDQTQYFQCKRSGTFRPKGSGKRLMKYQGTCKVQQNCTATIKLITKTDAKLLVDVCHTHQGHQRELQHTWLSKGKREQIAALLQQGVSTERILSDIREEALQGEDLKRYHMTDAKDLANIRRSFGLLDIQKHANDQQSVRAWIEEWSNSEHNPVLFFKFQGEETTEHDLIKEDFMIVFQSPMQKTMAQKFAANGVAIDATYGTTGCEFLLTTVMVIDECGQGFFIAWCLSNHEDFAHMSFFYRFIKTNCGTLLPRCVMSDMAPQFSNAWVGTGHIDRAWQQELRKIEPIVAAEIYKMLRGVLQEMDDILFQDYFSQLPDKLPLLNDGFNSYFFENGWERITVTNDLVGQSRVLII